MSPAIYLIEQSIKAIKKVDMSTYFLLFIVLLTNTYGLYSTILGKIISILIVLYLILNNNITFGIIAFLIVLLLNNGTVENFENNDKNSSKTNLQPDDTTDNKTSNNTPTETVITSSETKVELNDPIASFKVQHCKNGKLVDKDGNEINISDLSNAFPNIKFNIENEKCNPCEDNCGFKITSDVERITVEEKLRPTSSTQVSSD